MDGYDAFSAGVEPGGLRNRNEIKVLIAFLLKNVGRRRYQLALKGVLALLALWLWAWNVTLIVGYLY